MKKHLLLALFFVFTLQFSGQTTPEKLLIESFLELNSKETTKDEALLNQAVQKFDKQLIFTLENEDITTFKSFEKGLDSLYTDFDFKESEDYELFTLRNGFDRWNYILKDKKVILKELKTFDYFNQIYPLDNDEFLLIKRMDEMSFTCLEVYIYQRKAKLTARKALSVCSWTSIDATYNEKNLVTGEYELKGGLEHYNPLEIKFDPKRKIISYSFLSQINGKTITRKAKYKNGNFKIKSYDARTFEE